MLTLDLLEGDGGVDILPALQQVHRLVVEFLDGPFDVFGALIAAGAGGDEEDRRGECCATGTAEDEHGCLATSSSMMMGL
jgi:hypothetical protein